MKIQTDLESTNRKSYIDYFIQSKFGWIYFLIISGIYLLLVFITDNLIFTDHLYYRSFSDQMSIQSIDSLLSIKDRTWWLNYLLQPLIIIIKVSFTVGCISIGAILFDIKFEFKSLFKITLIAEFVFIAAQVLFLVNLYWNLHLITLENSMNFKPYSLLGYYGSENVVQWLHYPLQTLNLFELVYILCISMLLSKQWKPDFVESINIVLPSYGIGLLLWIVLVVFLTLQIS